MEITLQTKVTDQNRQAYLNSVYPQLTKSKNDLVHLDELGVSSFVLADCCGWHYKSLWPELNVIGLETLYSIKDYKLDRQKFQGIIDTRDYANVKWPTIAVNNCALIFDHSILLKYRSVNDIVKVILDAANLYQPRVIVFRASTLFIDDPRLSDRLTSLSTLLIPGYVVTSFAYDTSTLKISFKKKVSV